MKKIISFLLALSMLMSAAGAQQETRVIDDASFDSVRELVEWVQSRNPQEYGGELREFLEDAQKTGTLFTMMGDEEDIDHMFILSSPCELWYTFRHGDMGYYGQVTISPMGGESAQWEKDPAAYFRKKYPETEMRTASAKITIDGAVHEVTGVIGKEKIPAADEGAAEAEGFAFLAHGCEVKVTAWSPSFDDSIFDGISFARLELDGEYITDVTREKYWVREWKTTDKDGNTVTQSIADDSKIFERFGDVAQHSWYGWGVANAIKSGAMDGVGEGRFGPSLPMSRAMLVTCLWRLEKHRGYYTWRDAPIPFADVAQDKWYTLPVLWAEGNGIVNGVGGAFLPDREITRQDMAVIIYRYLTEFRGYPAELNAQQQETFPQVSFSDSGEISPYARAAVDWLSRVGILKGKEGNVFDPFGKITRAEAAVILARMDMPGFGGPDNMP